MKETRNGKEIKYEDDAFGTIEISRINGNSGVMFGTETNPDSFINLKVSTASLNRTLTNDYIHTGKRIIELKMTQNQFSEMITNMNYAGGTPCTITFLNGKQIPKLEKIPHINEYNYNEVKNNFVELNKNVVRYQNEILQLINKNKLSKNDKEDIQRKINGICQDIQTNTPFYLEMYREAMEKISSDVLSNTELKLQTKIQNLGIDSLKNTINKNIDINSNTTKLL